MWIWLLYTMDLLVVNHMNTGMLFFFSVDLPIFIVPYSEIPYHYLGLLVIKLQENQRCLEMCSPSSSFSLIED